MRVLVVEAEAGARVSLQAEVEHRQLSADIVGSVAAAREKLLLNSYDLICMDAENGADPGLSFAADVQQSETPFILTSRRITTQHYGLARATGAVGVLPRPYDLAQIQGLAANPASGQPARGARAMQEPPRILMYSHDTIGLGHMRRNANIAQKLLGARGDASVLMVVGSPAGFVFDMPPGMDFIKLPSLDKTGRNQWRADRLRISDNRARTLRAGLFRQAVESFEPHVVLVDHMPTGVWGELTDTLAWMRDAPFRPHVVLGLRDILDAPEETRKSWSANGARDAIRSYYDEIFVYGEARMYDTAAAYDLNRLTPDGVRYCGYVSAEPPAANRDAIRDRLGCGDRPFVLISGGGGRDAHPLLAASLDALAMIPEAERPVAMAVSGPLMDATLKADIEARAKAVGCHHAERLADFPAHLAAADLLVGMGGYNSVIEAMSLSVPMLVSPRLGPSAEQLTRARLFADKGLLEMLMPENTDAATLAARFRTVERRALDQPGRIDATGAAHAARRIAEIVDEGAVMPIPLAAIA